MSRRSNQDVSIAKFAAKVDISLDLWKRAMTERALKFGQYVRCADKCDWVTPYAVYGMPSNPVCCPLCGAKRVLVIGRWYVQDVRKGLFGRLIVERAVRFEERRIVQQG